MFVTLTGRAVCALRHSSNDQYLKGLLGVIFINLAVVWL